METNKKRYKREQDRKIRIQSLYNVDDLVLLHNDHKQNKLSPEFLGPYKIIEVRKPNYLIQIQNNKTLLVHGNRLKPYHLPSRLKPAA